jgi:DNA-binding Lrp family transcriptional regulator
MSLQASEIDGAVECLSAMRGINHSYLREDAWNLWFVATAPDEAALAGMLEHIGRTARHRVLDLRLVRQFHIDLGFSLSGRDSKSVRARPGDASILVDGDRRLLQYLTDGLALVERPYLELANRLGRSEQSVMERIGALTAAGIISRLGVIVRHRSLGWASNAMVVWDVPETGITAIGERLSRLSGVSLCYQRRSLPDVWPYRLYIMVHARTRAEALGVVATASALPELAGVPHKVLFSTHCFKQSGAWLHCGEAAA